MSSTMRCGDLIRNLRPKNLLVEQKLQAKGHPRPTSSGRGCLRPGVHRWYAARGSESRSATGGASGVRTTSPRSRWVRPRTCERIPACLDRPDQLGQRRVALPADHEVHGRKGGQRLHVRRGGLWTADEDAARGTELLERAGDPQRQRIAAADAPEPVHVGIPPGQLLRRVLRVAAPLASTRDPGGVALVQVDDLRPPAGRLQLGGEHENAERHPAGILVPHAGQVAELGDGGGADQADLDHVSPLAGAARPRWPLRLQPDSSRSPRAAWRRELKHDTGGAAPVRAFSAAPAAEPYRLATARTTLGGRRKRPCPPLRRACP